jgi:prephenate dehydrogenase
MNRPPNTIAIIGVGLIGGSIGLAIKKIKNKKIKIIGIGRNIKRLRLAKKMGAIDEFTTDIKAGVKNAEAIFICLPVTLIVPMAEKIFPYCKKETIITDVGSVKEPIVAKLKKMSSFVGGHPIAGSQNSSVKYSSPDIFSGATVVLTPTKNTSPAALNIVKKLWQDMGARITIMPAAIHDHLIAYGSHLPHLLAFALVNSVDNPTLAGRGFRDTTRIASSDPLIWAEIIFQNRKNIFPALRRLRREISKIEKSRRISQLTKIFARAKNKRDKLYGKQ